MVYKFARGGETFRVEPSSAARFSLNRNRPRVPLRAPPLSHASRATFGIPHTNQGRLSGSLQQRNGGAQFYRAVWFRIVKRARRTAVPGALQSARGIIQHSGRTAGEAVRACSAAASCSGGRRFGGRGFSARATSGRSRSA